MDWQLIISILAPMGAMLGWVYSRIDRRFEQVDKRFEQVDKRFDKIDERFEKVDERFEKVYEKFDKIDGDIKELRTSINRMEGAFYSKECCMLKEEKQNKKAE